MKLVCTLSPFAALFLLVTSVSAQRALETTEELETSLAADHLHTADTSRVTLIRIDGWTGELMGEPEREVPVVADPHASYQGCYENNIFSLFWTGWFAEDEILDWGVKRCEVSGLVKEIVLCYNTFALDQSVGGPGADLTVALYTGTRGRGRTGRELYRQRFSGLPGQLFPCQGFCFGFELRLDFSRQPLELPDGRIGLGFQNHDGLSGPILTYAPSASAGTRDAFDVYSPGPARRATYENTYTLSPTGIGSFFQVITEHVLEPAASSSMWNGTGANPACLEEASPARIGGNWSALVDLRDHTEMIGTFVVLSHASTSPLATTMGELLVDMDDLAAPMSHGVLRHTFEIPLDFTLAGTVMYAQGAMLGPDGLTLTNALEITTGF